MQLIMQTDRLIVLDFSKAFDKVANEHTRFKTPIETIKYFLYDTELKNVSSAKYLGVTISNDLTLNTHIDNNQESKLTNWILEKKCSCP